jgi:hypothetical protein
MTQIDRGGRPQISGYDFGINVKVQSGDAPFFFGHAGGTSGYLCFVWHEPEHDITVAFFGSSLLVDVFHQRRQFEFELLLEKALFDLTVKQTQGTPISK